MFLQSFHKKYTIIFAACKMRAVNVKTYFTKNKEKFVGIKALSRHVLISLLN